MNLVLAITGASGAVYPKLFLDFIREQKDVKLHVVSSANGLRIFKEELGLDLREYWPGVLSAKDFDVPFVSGSARMDAMVIMPCSTGTLGRMANGVSDDNITRGADVFLKERRKLIVVPRETPLSQIHLENMLKLARSGATIIPAMPSFYSLPKTIEETAWTVVSRVCDHLGFNPPQVKRWKQSSTNSG